MVIRTLVVDDEPLARERLRTLLAAESDIEVVAECANGREAVRELTVQAPAATLSRHQDARTRWLRSRR